VQNVIARLQELGGGEAVPLEGREENIVFEVPKELPGPTRPLLPQRRQQT
jgi:hypothetical protein